MGIYKREQVRFSHSYVLIYCLQLVITFNFLYFYFTLSCLQIFSCCYLQNQSHFLYYNIVRQSILLNFFIGAPECLDQCQNCSCFDDTNVNGEKKKAFLVTLKLNLFFLLRAGLSKDQNFQA